MHPTRPASVLAIATAILTACASSVEDSWTDPSVAGRPLGFQNVAAVALLQEGAMRRVAEDELARAIETRSSAAGGAVQAVPSYTLLPAGELGDAERARARLAAAGFDGAVVVSVVDSQQRVSSSPGMGAVGWGGPRAWMLYDANVRTDTIVRVQTNIYSVAEGKLVWSGTSRTLNPRDVRDLIDDVVRDVGRALRDQGLVR
jgi:hypothetical protein